MLFRSRGHEDYDNFKNTELYGDDAPLTPPHQNTNYAEVKGCAYALAARPESKASNQPYDDNFLESQYGDEAPLTPPRQNADDVEVKVKGCCVYALAPHLESGSEASKQPYDDNAPLTPPRQPPDDENVPLAQLAAPPPPPPPPPDDDDNDAPLVKLAVAVAAINPP